MIRGVSGQVMTDRSVGSADATPESRVRRAPSAAACKLSSGSIIGRRLGTTGQGDHEDTQFRDLGAEKAFA